MDTERLRNYFKLNGFRPVIAASPADVIIYIACGMRENDALATIERLSADRKSNAMVVIYGCLPAMCTTDESKGVFYVPLQSSDMLDSVLDAAIPLRAVPHPPTANSSRAPKADLYYWDPRLKLPYCADVYSVLVSEGCSCACSYCSIRKATGALRSRPVGTIVGDISRGLLLGYRIFRLQCENLGVYGDDTVANLTELLQRLAEIEETFSVDLPDLHPRAFVEHYQAIIAFAKRKNLYLMHLPIQAGSQRILDLMKRHYVILEVTTHLRDFQDRFPKLRIGTDFIAGFPSETEEEFEESCRIMRAFRFDWIYLHGFRAMAGTSAAVMDGQVSEDVIAQRIQCAYDRIPRIVCWLNGYSLAHETGCQCST